jgi:hypothetical protein
MRSTFAGFGLALCLLLGLAALLPGRAGQHLVEHSLPAMRWFLGATLPEVEILSIGLAPEHDRVVLRVRSDLARPMSAGSVTLRPLRDAHDGQGWMQLDLTLGGLFQHALLFMALVAGWPATSWMQRAHRIAVATPVAVLLYGVTLCSTLLAELWLPVHEVLIGGDDPASLNWSQFLMGGGGSMLAIACAGLVSLRPRPFPAPATARAHRHGAPPTAPPRSTP